MAWLQPSQLTEGLALVKYLTYTIPPCSQARGGGWGGKERRKDRLPPTLTPSLCRHLFPRRNSNLNPERVSLGILLPTLNRKKQTAEVQRKFQNPISHRWRGWSIKGCHPHVTDEGEQPRAKGSLSLTELQQSVPGPAGPLTSWVMPQFVHLQSGPMPSFLGITRAGCID